jgi:hypothetical protein
VLGVGGLVVAYLVVKQNSTWLFRFVLLSGIVIGFEYTWLDLHDLAEILQEIHHEMTGEAQRLRNEMDFYDRNRGKE